MIGITKSKSIRALALLLVVVMLFGVLSVGAFAATKSGWYQSGSYWYYYNSSGKLARSTNSVRPSSGLTCTFDSKGRLVTGEVVVSGSVSYYIRNYTMLKSTWISVGGSWYYLTANGKMAENSAQNGPTKIGAYWYFFDGSGRMCTNTSCYSYGTGKYYYAMGSGRLATGLYTVGNYKYYYDTSTAARFTGWKYLNGHWYLFDTCMRTGLVFYSGKYYYLDPNGSITGSAGAMVSNRWMRLDTYYPSYFSGTTWTYIGTDGSAIGWLYLNSHWYYFASYGSNNVKNGSLVTGWRYINNYWYYFDDSGIMQTGWLYLDGIYYLKSDGSMATGWTKLDGSWYYFDSSGRMQTGWAYVNGGWYYMDPNTGVMQTGWLRLTSGTFYLDSSGKMVIGWQQIDGTWHYFNNCGYMLTDTTTPDGYYVDANGIWNEE